MDVPDSKLYYYLLRLGVVAYQQEPRIEAAAITPTQFDPLPKHTLKTLMQRFNALAMAPTNDSDAQLRRSYLAFYSQLLSLKKQESETYDEFKMRPDLLIIRFITCCSKELERTKEHKNRERRAQAVNDQALGFTSLLMEIVKQINAKSPVLGQLEKYQTYQVKLSQQVEQLDYDVQKMDALQHLKTVLKSVVVTDQMLRQDVARNTNVRVKEELREYVDNLRHNQHPVYSPEDFDDAWESWRDQEIQVCEALIEKIKDNLSADTVQPVIPEDPRIYFFKILQYCMQADIDEPLVLGSKSQKLLGLCCTYWRIPSNTYASLVLQCSRAMFQSNKIDVDYLSDCFEFVANLSDCPVPEQWPRIDAKLAQTNANDLKMLIVQRLGEGLLQVLDKPPKLGPLIQLIDEYLAVYTGSGVHEKHLGHLRKSILVAAEKSYDAMLKRIPRDDTLDLQHIGELGDGVIAVAKRLQKRYAHPLFGELNIARLVCSRQLKLFGIDFMPMFKFCVESQRTKGQDFNFDEIVALYQTLTTLKNLYEQVSNESFAFDIEKTFYPYILEWAKHSAQLSKTWVQPAIEHDTFQPIDSESQIMYSTSVKDLFESFSSSLKVVQSVQWENQYHVSKIYTLLLKGVGEASSLWAQKIRNFFIAEMAEPPVQQSNKWLELAKETIQGQHTNPPEPFHFKTETLVYLNDVDAAHDRLFKMEESLDSDQIARRIEVEEKRKKADAPTYLYTLNIVKAEDLLPDPNKNSRDAYVTVIDEQARRKLGRTRTVYENLNPVWNQRFELETVARTQNVKIMVWDENLHSNHGLCGSAFLKLDAREFQHKEWGTIFKSIPLEHGRIDVQVSMDMEREDIRFFFGKALRFLDNTKKEMIEFIVEKFSNFIKACLSIGTIDVVLNRSKFSLNAWLPQSQRKQVTLSQEQVEDTLDPLFDYLNRNFATLAAVLTDELRLEVMKETWKVTLGVIEGLILARLERKRHVQHQLTSTEVDIVYTWLRSLRDFFHNDGAGPSLELLQDRQYQKIMSIPVYYDMTTMQLRSECDKITKSTLKQLNSTRDMVQRQRTVMAHRNRRVVQTQEAEMRKAHMATLDLDKDDILLRILRMRKDDDFIERQLDHRRRIEVKASTERALQGL